MLSATHQLSSAHLEALNQLLSACHASDKAVIPVYPHLLKHHRPGLGSLLYRQDHQLLAFLACFHFYPHAAEIALLVHPEHRHQGIAKALWEALYAKLGGLYPDIKQLIVTAPSGHQKAWFHAHQFEFDSTEYNMRCTPYIPEKKTSAMCSIKTATPADIKALQAIDKACFNTNRPNPIQRIEQLLKNPQIKIFLMHHNKTPIGQAHLVCEHNKIWLTDFAILPDQQNQGFGEILLSYCLKYTHLNHPKNIHLTVAKQNVLAVHLYQNMGFQIYNTIDYYKRRFSLDSF